MTADVDVSHHMCWAYASVRRAAAAVATTAPQLLLLPLLLMLLVPVQKWVEDQKEFAGVEKIKRNVWVQVQLDGTVRSSGAGTPPWDRFVMDLPTLDSVRTQMTDGIGPSI